MSTVANRDLKLTAACGYVAALALLTFVSSALGADPETRLRELKTKVQPLLEKHCLDCHSGGEPDAGLSLDNFDEPLDFLKGRRIWENALHRMDAKEMPPEDASEMTDAERKFLMDWIRTAIEEFECGLEPNPGQVTLRRLNATEYQNTVRDLLGVNYSPAKKFPGDDVGYGFDNIGDVLTLPPLLMEKYFVAAEQISRYCIKTPPPAQVFTSEKAGSDLKVEGKPSKGRNELTLSSNGVATFREQLPWSGTYDLTVTAAGDQAGNEPCLMTIVIDGKETKRIRVPNERSKPKDFNIRLRLRAGSREIGVGFANDFYRAPSGGQKKLDRNLMISHVTIVGKKTAKQSLDPGELPQQHRQIIFTSPSNKDELPQATQAVIRRLAFRAFRRPVEAEEVNRLVALAASVQNDGGSFEESIQVALQAVLISPQFLFRVEPPQAQANGFGAYRDLDDFELASRISYFLWSSMPDQALFAMANKGELRDRQKLRELIARMIRDPKSNAFIQNFAAQWLTLRKLDEFKPNPSLFPKWNDRISDLAERETMTFFAGVMRRDMSVMRLLDADFSFMNEELAEFYGIRGVQGNNFQPVSLKGTGRAGLLTQASILAVTSNPTRTSPVKRGKWILENLLASPPPPAPPGVPELKEKGQLIGNLRQRLEQHRVDPACASCHKLMDPLGFALENFNAVGQFRTKDEGVPIDASGTLPGGIKVNGAEELRNVLVNQHQDKFVECLVEKMLTYALGRGLEYYDKCAVDKIVADLEKNDHKFSTLLLAIIESEPFQKKGLRTE